MNGLTVLMGRCDDGHDGACDWRAVMLVTFVWREFDIVFLIVGEDWDDWLLDFEFNVILLNSFTFCYTL